MTSKTNHSALSSDLPDVTMTIDGHSERSKRVLPVFNPATEETAGHVPDCEPAQLDRAFAAAQRAQTPWALLPWEERADALRTAASVVEGAATEVGSLQTAEMGRPIAETEFEARLFADWLRYFADMELEEVVVRDDANAGVRVLRRPLGVIAVTTPWNGPMGTLGMKVGPALAAGNTVVVKPSPLAPLSTLLVGELVRPALPPGVLNVVSGPDSLGVLLCQHPTPAKITFSGSIDVGKSIAAAAASDLKRLTLELGGNDAAIVLDNTDVSDTARRLFRAAFGNCGQACIAVKRIYAVGDVYGPLVEELARVADEAVVGDPMDRETQIGPMISEPQRRRIDEVIRDAVDRGARVVSGGKMIDRRGFFYEPTIVVDAEDGMPLVDAEQFGPALPVIHVADVDDAVRRANATEFGLGASVWSADIDRAGAIGERLEVGTVWINTHRASLGPSQPQAGWKWSGMGVENGVWGLESFTQIKTVYEHRA